MNNVSSSEAAKVVVRRNTEEVLGKGRFDVFDELADEFILGAGWIERISQPLPNPQRICAL